MPRAARRRSWESRRRRPDGLVGACARRGRSRGLLPRGSAGGGTPTARPGPTDRCTTVVRVADTNDLAALGRLLAAPARAAMVDALFDGRAWTVAELAAAAGVSPSTASEHLQALAQGDSSAGPARAATGATGSRATRSPGRSRASRRWRRCGRRTAFARSRGTRRCGQLAPATTTSPGASAWRSQTGSCRPECCSRPSRASRRRRRGAQALASAGIDLDALSRTRRPATLACLDWSEQRPHLAGALGAALLGRLESTGGLQRLAPGRAVRLLPAGRALLGSLGVTIDAV